MLQLPETFPPLPTVHNFRDLAAQRFWRLTVVGFGGTDGKTTWWWCRCDCGAITKPGALKLRQKKTVSCGCWHAEISARVNTVHGHSRRNRRSPEYFSWVAMRKRCLCPTDHAYPDYGGRGISICERWKTGEDGRDGFSCFLGDMGARPSPKHSIDRIDNDKGYEPGNCRWATPKDQANNRRKPRRRA